VTVVYALPGRSSLREVRLAQGATVLEAIAASGITEEFPELKQKIGAVGVFANRVTLDHVVEDGDRVEIYRPLQADPREARRRRARGRRPSSKGAAR
jgi:putative ubiquitin-RnfH superfamily antitoxin RatB of RatAB toxin-antitoxin module